MKMDLFDQPFVLDATKSKRLENLSNRSFLILLEHLNKMDFP